MTDQHRASPADWLLHAASLDDADSSCILELRARIEALEVAQLEQAESHRFCTDAIVRRVEALEATQHAHADVSRLSDAEREQVTQLLAKPAAWRPLDIETTCGTEAATATAQQILRAPIVVEGTFEHRGETYRFKAKPERESAMAELRAASAEARPAASLDEMVIDAMLAAHVKGGGTSFPVPHPDEIQAAIRAVADWLDVRGNCGSAAELRQEADHG
jgi:hypothetical protein